jgi:ubiquitin-conjugating enzyme E2 O
VLVKEPYVSDPARINHHFSFLTRSLRGETSWFCEPAYDKLRGTEEGIINSRLYNEKAYVLSRGFVRRALEIPLGSLESEISWLYHSHGRLAKVLCDARALVEKSRGEASPEPSSATGGDHDRELAVPRLTTGGIITLERTLAKLEALQQAPTP